MAQSVIIVGAGGLGQEVRWLAEEAGREVVGFLDDSEPAEAMILDRPWLGAISAWPRYASAEVVVAIGNPRVRRRVVRRIEEAEATARFATLVHPSVARSRFVTLGPGTMVAAGSVLTVDIVVGAHGLLDRQCTVGHNCRLGAFVTVAPMAAVSGRVVLEDCVEVGAAAVIRQGLTLSAGSMLGMGGVLTKSMEANAVYIGNPARFMKSLDPVEP